MNNDRKNVLILGATSAIAKAIAHKLAAEHHNLILAGRDTEEIELLARDIELRWNVKASTLQFDALAYNTHQDFFQACIKEAWTIDGVILAYGYLGDQKTAQADFHEAKKILDVNFTSCVSILEIAAAYLEERADCLEGKGNGFICVLSSVAGDRGRQSNYLYGSAKGALSLYLQGLRNRLSRSDVQVLTVKPGFVDTKMTYGLDGMFLVAKPEAIAEGMYKAIHKSKDIVYLPWFWTYIMLIIKSIPERIFKRMKL